MLLQCEDGAVKPTCILPSFRAGPSSASRRMNRPMLYSFPPLRLKPKPRWLRSSSTAKHPCGFQTRIPATEIAYVIRNQRSSEHSLLWLLISTFSSLTLIFINRHQSLGGNVSVHYELMKVCVCVCVVCTFLEPAVSNPMSFCRTEFFISLSPFLTQRRHFIPSPFSVSTAVTQQLFVMKICEYQHPHTATKALSVGFIMRRAETNVNPSKSPQLSQLSSR